MELRINLGMMSLLALIIGLYSNSISASSSSLNSPRSALSARSVTPFTSPIIIQTPSSSIPPVRSILPLRTSSPIVHIFSSPFISQTSSLMVTLNSSMITATPPISFASNSSSFSTGIPSTFLPISPTSISSFGSSVSPVSSVELPSSSSLTGLATSTIISSSNDLSFFSTSIPSASPFISQTSSLMVTLNSSMITATPPISVASNFSSFPTAIPSIPLPISPTSSLIATITSPMIAATPSISVASNFSFPTAIPSIPLPISPTSSLIATINSSMIAATPSISVASNFSSFPTAIPSIPLPISQTSSHMVTLNSSMITATPPISFASNSSSFSTGIHSTFLPISPTSISSFGSSVSPVSSVELPSSSSLTGLATSTIISSSNDLSFLSTSIPSTSLFISPTPSPSPPPDSSTTLVFPVGSVSSDFVTFFSTFIPETVTPIFSSIFPTPTPTLIALIPSLTLNVSSIEISDASIDQEVVQCVLNNSTQPAATPFWVDQDRTVASNNQILTLSFAAFPHSTQFFCLANISSSTIEIGLNYTVLVTDSVIDTILEVNGEVSVGEAVDFSGRLSVIAEGNISVSQTNQLLNASLNILRLLNASTLTTETAMVIVSATFNTIERISDMTMDGDATTSISTTEQESIGNNLANNLDAIATAITNVPTSVVEPITINSTETSLISQVFTDVTAAIIVPINIPGSSGRSSIVFPTNLFQNLGPIRVTAVTSNALLSFPATITGLGNATIDSPVNSISILGIDENVIISPPIEITFPQIDTQNRVPFCVFWNLETQAWDTTGVTIELGNNGVTCLASHLTSFAVLTLTRESTANEVETRALRIVSYILLSLSLISLLISLILFILSGKRFFDVEMNRMYFNYALALTLAIFSFIFGVNLGVLNNIWCKIATILVHYFWLSVFTWGLAIAILISYLMTLGVLNRKALFWPLFVLAWTLPIPIVVITMIIGLVRGNYVRLNENCFLSLGYIWSLIGPIFVIIVFNIIGLFIAITRVIQLSFRKIDNGKKNIFTAVKHPLIAACVLLPILGMPWIIILSDFFIETSNKPTTLFEWIFLILIGPSGVVFLLTFTLANKAVRKTLCGKIYLNGSMKRKFSSPPQTKTKTDIEFEKLVETPV